MRDLTQLSEQWAQGTQGRVREIATELRNQGERAVSTVSQQVEHNLSRALRWRSHSAASLAH